MFLLSGMSKITLSVVCCNPSFFTVTSLLAVSISTYSLKGEKRGVRLVHATSAFLIFLLHPHQGSKLAHFGDLTLLMMIKRRNG